MSVLDTVVASKGEQRTLRSLLRSAKALKAALDALPIEVVLEVLVAPDGVAVDLLVDDTKLDLAPRLTAAHENWAREVLDAACAAERVRSEWLVRWAFLVLARAGVACAPRWERIFPAVRARPGPATAAVTEAARTLPEDRVLAVALAAMERSPVVAAEVGCAILAAHDDEALARHVLAHRSAAWDRARLRKALAPLADRPGIARALAADAEADASRPRLTLVSRTTPRSLDELDATRREQLALAGDRLEGRTRPLEERWALGDAEGSFGGLLEHRLLATADGALRIDAWLYAGDAGTFFRADTTEVLATLVQGGVQLAPGQPAWLDDALALASQKEG
jgi:hypothetical protein